MKHLAVRAIHRGVFPDYEAKNLHTSGPRRRSEEGVAQSIGKVAGAVTHARTGIVTCSPNYLSRPTSLFETESHILWIFGYFVVTTRLRFSVFPVFSDWLLSALRNRTSPALNETSSVFPSA